MLPTLRSADIILASSLPYLFRKPRINDIIITKDPRDNRSIIKRIVRIENSHYFLQGDNEKESTDSRQFGMIERKNITGKVIYVLRGSSVL